MLPWTTRLAEPPTHYREMEGADEELYERFRAAMFGASPSHTPTAPAHVQIKCHLHLIKTLVQPRHTIARMGL